MFGFGIICFATLIVVFTFFYTAITVPTNKMSDDLREAEVLSQVLDQVLKLQILTK
jgi:preprotein translocase subunit SecY